MLIEIEDLKEKINFDNSLDSDLIRIRNYLKITYSDNNSFWLRIEKQEYPCVNIAIHKNLATANYFSERVNDGEDWVSKSNISDIDPNQETIFYYINGTEKQEMSNSVVIMAESAREVALQFFLNPFQRPSAIEWYEL